MNYGADLGYVQGLGNKFCDINLNDLIKRREVGHRITVPDNTVKEVVFRREERENEGLRSKGVLVNSRVSVYRGHPLVRRANFCTEAGRLIKLPNSLVELKNIAGKTKVPNFFHLVFSTTIKLMRVERFFLWCYI